MNKQMRRFGSIAVMTMLVSVGIVLSIVTIPRDAGASGPTIVGGRLLRDTWWSREGSPYWVEANVIVPYGVHLSVETGIDVLFDGPFSLYVEGVLRTYAQAGIPPPHPYVLYSSKSTVKNPGDWGAIQFNSTTDREGGVVKSRVEFATYGVYFDHSSARIENSTLADNIRGVSGGDSSPLIRNNIITDNTEFGISLTRDDSKGERTTIDYNTIIANPYGIWTTYSSGTYSNNTIMNGLRGIEADHDCTADMEFNTVSDMVSVGLASFNCDELTFENNTVTDTLTGIYVEYAASRMLVANNTLHLNTQNGLHLIESSADIVDNNIQMNGAGVELMGGVEVHTFFVGRNVITHNDGCGIATIHHTIIHDNNISSNSNCGIAIGQNTYLPSIEVHYNDIKLNGGVGVFYDATNPAIHHNNIENNEIGMRGSGNAVINWNNICNNALYGAKNDNPSLTINAEHNWWNDPLGPKHIDNPNYYSTHGDKAEGPMDFDPWETSRISL